MFTFDFEVCSSEHNYLVITYCSEALTKFIFATGQNSRAIPKCISPQKPDKHAKNEWQLESHQVKIIE